jgi:hypothetical protein
MNIFGFHLTPDGITISNGEHQKESPYLDFLLRYVDSINVCYNLDYFTANLLVLLKLNEKQLRELNDTTELKVKAYKLKYVPKKFLSIIKDELFVLFSDASQYMDTYNLVDGDSLSKAKEAQRIGMEIYQSLKKLGLHPQNVISPIACFEKEMLSKLDLPSIEDIPLEAGHYAYEACQGPWVEARMKGAFKNTVDMDLSSCYPSLLAKAPDCRYGTFRKVTEFVTEAYYGHYYGMVNMTADFHPIIYRKTHRKSYTPKGEWERVSSMYELQFIDKYKLGEYEIYDGWVWIPDKLVFPYRGIVNWLYEKKETSKGFGKLVVKRIMSALWGYTLMQNADPKNPVGDYFNPIVGEYVETGARLEVARFVLDNNLQDRIISIAVDGVLVDKEECHA